jgi:hypothetical protein
MASYLRKHVDRVADVPAQLQRFFKLIRDLDEKAALLQAEVDERARQRLQAAAAAAASAGAAAAAAASKGGPPASKKARTSEGQQAGPSSSTGGGGGGDAAAAAAVAAAAAAATVTANNNTKTTAVLGAEVEAGALKVLSLAEEKMRVAAQVYDTVDAHIRALDADLRALEASIRGDREALAVGDGETGHGLLGEPLPAGASAQAFGGGAGAGGGGGGGGKGGAGGGDGGRVKRKYTRRKGVDGSGGGGGQQQQQQQEQQQQQQEQQQQQQQDDDEAAAAAAAAAAANADAREPRYCVCNGVSYGDMIACDNPDCLIEWFHYACVGVKAQPKGRWYCPECSKTVFGAAQQQQAL